MITKKLIDKRDKVLEATDQLEDAIFARMAVIARRMNLDEMLFTMYGNRYLRGTRRVASKQLDALDQFYCDFVHAGGHESVWTPEKGWQ